jgi:hypothetical protein
MNIYHKQNCITVTYKQSPKYLLYDWHKNFMSLEIFKEAHLTALEAIKTNSIISLISDSSKVTDVPVEECLEWLGKGLVPLLAKAGVKQLITIVPKTALSRIGTKSWQRQVLGIDMYDVKDMQEALDLII